jgi:protein translocase SecG subunit
MNALDYIFGVLLILCSLVLILLVTVQNPKGRGLSGAIGGDMGNGVEGRARGNDALYAKLTKYFGIAFGVLVVLVSLTGMLK